MIFPIHSDDEESEAAESIYGKNESSYSPRHWTQVMQEWLVCIFRTKQNSSCKNINHTLHLDTLFQIISLLPVYILQICYGMNSGYPAIATAQLLVPESCPGFQITKYQAGVIGNNSISTSYVYIHIFGSFGYPLKIISLF